MSISIEDIWAGHKVASKKLRLFANSCIRHERSGEILYIVKIVEDKAECMNTRHEIFTTLRDSNISSPSMSWPFLSIASEGSLAITRLVVPKLMIWDFRTGKRLN